MSNAIENLFAKTRNEKRSALIAYLPAGFPSQAESLELIDVLVSNGVDLVEIGFPYSDPLMDGPIIQAAVQKSLDQGTKASDVFAAVARVKAAGAVPVVMSYFSPIFRYGSERFLTELVRHGGAGVITPDLIPDEAEDFLSSAKKADISNIFLVAPSSTDQRIELVSESAAGFIYAASLMGVTGVKSAQTKTVSQLVDRVRKYSAMPVCVGLGVNTAEQVQEIAQFADGVIVGSAFVKAVLVAPDFHSAITDVGELAASLAAATKHIG